MLVLGLDLTSVASGRLQPQPAQLINDKSEALQNLRESERGLRWLTSRQGEFTIRGQDQANWARLRQATYAAMPPEVRSFWGKFQWWDNVWIRDLSRQPLRRRDFPQITATTADDLQLQRTAPHTYTFLKPIAPGRGLTRVAHQTLAKWLSIMIVNWAALDQDPDGPDTHRVYGWSSPPVFDRYEWKRDPMGALQGRALDRKWDPAQHHPDQIMARSHRWGEPLTFLTADGSARAHADLDALQHTHAVVLQGHPALQAGPTLRIPTKSKEAGASLKKRMVDTHVRQLIASPVNGLEKVIHRLTKQRTHGSEFLRNLQCVPIKTLTGQPWGTTGQQHFFWYRLTIGALPVRDLTHQLPPCPHAFCGVLEEPTVDHIVWSCTGARRVWTQLDQRWTQTRDRLTETILARSAAGIQAPQLGRTTRQAIHEQTTDDIAIATATHRAWRVACAAAAHSLWLQRNDAVFNGLSPNVFEHTGKGLRAASDQIQALGVYMHDHAGDTGAGTALLTVATRLRSFQYDYDDDTLTVRLYFDGGSRGNPGRTGAGSILLERRDAGWTIVWWNYHYMSESASNNAAEHDALRRGVEECAKRYRREPAHIVIIGGSQLVLRQVEGTNRTRERSLHQAVSRTLKTLRDIATFDLRHTLRGGNKMADMLANTAMDNQRTDSGPQGPDAITSSAYDHLTADTNHPTSPTYQHHDLIAYLTTQLTHHRSLLPTRSHKRRQPPAPQPDNPKRVPRPQKPT